MTQTSDARVDGPVKVVVAPALDDAQTATWAAATLARWFDAPLQLIANNSSEVEALETFGARLGVLNRPVICLDGSDLAHDIGSQVSGQGPVVVVLATTAANVELATQLSQPTYLVPCSNSRRLPAGPLLLGMNLDESDIEVLAVAAMWAVHLDCQIRIVVGTGTNDDDRHIVDAAAGRLRSMNLNVQVDEVEDPERDIITIAQSRMATSLLVPASRAAETRHRADEMGAAISLLVCPGTTESDPALRLLTSTSVEPSSNTALEIMERAECLKLLGQQTIGRLGYIDEGWPTVVPINYREERGQIFIRSLPGHKLTSARESLIACLEVDQVDKWARTGWSVLVHGPLEVITDPAVLKAAWANDPDPWITSNQWSWLRLRPLSISGRRALKSGYQRRDTQQPY